MTELCLFAFGYWVIYAWCKGTGGGTPAELPPSPPPHQPTVKEKVAGAALVGATKLLFAWLGGGTHHDKGKHRH